VREFYLLVATLAPLFVLGLLERSGVEPPTWIRVIGITWFGAGALYIGWYDGWVKRALVGVLIFVVLMGLFVLWSGALPGGWPTVANVVLVAAAASVLVVVGIATGSFAEMRDAFNRALGRDAQHAKGTETKAQ
jgi:hypothetical protein